MCKSNKNSDTHQEKSQIFSTLDKRAKSKYLTSNIISELAKLPSKLSESYQNTLLCCSTIIVENQDKWDANSPKKAHSTYCKNRFCLTCNRIYMANQINKYSLYFKDNFLDPHMVVLSRKTIAKTSRQALRKEIQSYQEHLKQILDNFRKQSTFKPKVISKLEVTYNSLKDTYHPHLHILCDSKEIADFILEKWLKKNPKALKDKGNKTFPLDFSNDQEREKSMKEVFKYTVKPISDALNDLAKAKKARSTVKKNGKLIRVNGHKLDQFVNLEALNMLYEAIAGLRLLRIYGISDEELEKETFEDSELKGQTISDGVENGIYVWRSKQKLHSLIENFDFCKNVNFTNIKIYKDLQKLQNRPNWYHKEKFVTKRTPLINLIDSFDFKEDYTLPTLENYNYIKYSPITEIIEKGSNKILALNFIPSDYESQIIQFYRNYELFGKKIIEKRKQTKKKPKNQGIIQAQKKAQKQAKT